MSQHPINPPMVPTVLDPEPHHPPAGDWRDDDGLALDSYFEAMPLGPLTSVLVKTLRDAIDYKPEKSSRLVRAHVIFSDVATAAYPYPARPVLPADPNRTTLVIQSSDNGFNKGAYFHSESFAALADADSAPDTGAFWLPTKTQLVIPNYTGPLWAAPSAVGTAGVCSWFVLAVTA